MQEKSTGDIRVHFSGVAYSFGVENFYARAFLKISPPLMSAANDEIKMQVIFSSSRGMNKIILQL